MGAQSSCLLLFMFEIFHVNENKVNHIKDKFRNPEGAKCSFHLEDYKNLLTGPFAINPLSPKKTH